MFFNSSRSPAVAVWAVAALVTSLLVLTPTPAAAARIFTVDAGHITGEAATDDPPPGLCSAGNCSLREAVIAANASPGPDRIAFAAAGAIELGRRGPESNDASVNDLDVDDSLLVEGHPDGTTVSAFGFGVLFGQDARAFGVNETTFELRDVTIIGGADGGGFGGGALSARGSDVTLTRVTLLDNVAVLGGAVSQAFGTLRITDSTFSGNQTVEGGSGGALDLRQVSEVRITGSTFSDNFATTGGAIRTLFDDPGKEPLARIASTDFFDNRGNSADFTEGGGGAIFADGVPLRIVRSTIVGNGGESLSRGGGIVLLNTPTPARIVDTAVTVNQAEFEGGGIFLGEGGELAITRASVSLNTLSDRASLGGGIYVGPRGTFLSATNVTLSTNTAVRGSALLVDRVTLGGGFRGAGVAAELVHSTVTDNRGGDALEVRGDADPFIRVRSTIIANRGDGSCSDRAVTSAGFNLEDGDVCGLRGPGDVVDTDPRLEDLQGEGLEAGVVGVFHPLAEGSPAIDAADPRLCGSPVGLDQRRVRRPQGSGCDIGAVEFVAPGADPGPGPGQAAAASCTADDGTPSGTGIGQGVVRVEGLNRIQTAVAASRAACGDGRAPAVVLTRADRFPDAQAGTPLAIDLGAPLLLSDSAALSAETEAELERVLTPGGRVYLLGGEAALSGAVQDRLDTLGYDSERYGGANRFETAAIIAAEGLGDPGTLLVADGGDFAASIVAGAAAGTITPDGTVDAAVLLTSGDDVPPETQAYLNGRAGPPPTQFAIGGSAAQALPAAEAVSGATPSEVSVAVADRFWDNPIVVGVARADDFADGLTGGGLVGRADVGPGPILLVEPELLPAVVEGYIEAHADGMESAVIFGGTAAVSSGVGTSVAHILGR